MSITSDIRLKRRGQLDLLNKERETLDATAIDALTIILLKADPLADIATLDTSAILRAAENLDETVRAIKGVDKQIAAIKEELFG
jgi:hypothetical protein